MSNDTKTTNETPAADPAAAVSATPAEPTATEPMATVAAEPLTAEQIADLQARAAKADESWDRYVRTVAELDNYRKRAARERSEAIQYANESLLTKLLPVLDNFEMALAAASDAAASVESIRTGVAMINTQLRQALGEAGLEELDAAGQAFDPNLHEAVSQLASTEVPEGRVLHQIRKGYRLRGRLLRPAAVVVAKSPAEAAPA